MAVPFDGELHLRSPRRDAPCRLPLWSCLRIHIEVAGTSFYHQGSANLIDDAIRPEHRGPTTSWRAWPDAATRDYWQLILSRLEPRTIVPTHYDDFFRPLDQPMGFTTNVNLHKVPDEVQRAQPRL